MERKRSTKDHTHDSPYKRYMHALAEKHAEETIASRQKHSLLPPGVEKDKLILEFEKQVAEEHYTETLSHAFAIMSQEGKQRLTPEQWKQYTTDMATASARLANFAYDTMPKTSIATFLGIHAATLHAIHGLAHDLFHDQPYESLALYTLLASIDDHNPERWYQLGMCLQDLKQNEKAIKAYLSCLALDPRHLHATAFLCECYIATSQLEEASRLLEQVKHLLHEQAVERVQAFIHYVDELKRNVSQKREYGNSDYSESLNQR